MGGNEMKKQFIKMLVCPMCHHELTWNIVDESETRVINAQVACTSCHEKYEVRDEIAVFLTDALTRNDLWEQGENGLIKYLDEHTDIYDRLMTSEEESLNGADYWYKASYFEMKRNFNESSRMYKKAFKKIYTKEYIDGWDSQMDYIVNQMNADEPIIDIASGKGYLIEKLLRETENDVVATDFSPTILLRNKAYYQSKGLYEKLSLIAFDARKTPFRTQSIVNMTSNMGIQNIEQPGAVVDELSRISKNRFMSVMIFIDESDKTHLEMFSKMGGDTYATRKSALKVFNKANWDVEVINSFTANIKPTPVGEIIKDAGIDGFPVKDTRVEFCIIDASK